MRAVGRTHPGLRRPTNEDSAFVGRRLAVVADGMGGHEFGEVASAIATDAVIFLDDGPGPNGLPEELAAAIELADERLRSAVEKTPSLRGMGTTMTAMFVDGEQVAIGHVGDSRAYRLHDDELEQLTTDHTVVQLLVQQGILTPEQAVSHPRGNLITNALQGEPGGAQVETTTRRAVVGDRYLLCSDGLPDYVSDADIRDALEEPDPDVVLDRLLQLALDTGAPDNITCVVADLVPDDQSGDAGEHPPYLLGAAREVADDLAARNSAG
ncbi:PP2C family protein-serine/threonine phosphatase [Angustibacter sp. McL0619]|uniref:PP2C family protein-serine/threonine phosphatase n=1 Tax=Angustibacter sp. McL0619 TaxID=3415676 RepID=UPI003CF26C4C